MFCTLAGQRVVDLNVLVKYYGTPVIYATTDQPAAALATGTTTTLTVADLTLTCTVFRTAAFAGKQPSVLVGGYSGWDNAVSALAYNFPSSNVTSDIVIGDLAKAVGEQAVVAAPASLGPNYFREAGPASRTLKSLAGAVWYVDPTGVTQVGPRTNANPIGSPFEVIDYEGARGKFTIATENPADWMPARTFTSPTLSGAQTIASTQLHFDKSGALRLEVYITA